MFYLTNRWPSWFENTENMGNLFLKESNGCINAWILRAK